MKPGTREGKGILKCTNQTGRPFQDTQVCLQPFALSNHHFEFLPPLP